MYTSVLSKNEKSTAHIFKWFPDDKLAQKQSWCICREVILKHTDVNQTPTITFGAAVSEQAASGGERYVK